MKTIKLHVLCEGQTELRFASRVLATHLILKDILVLPQLLITSKRKNARGGMLSYQQVVRDLTVMMKSATDSETEAHIFTTMFDLYALPSDFPGYKATSTASGCVRVAAIEDAFAQAIDSRRFLPYIQLHEFEALVLCGLPELAQSYPNATRELTALQAELQRVYGEDMEAVDGGLETAPSKRISKAMVGKYKYDKVKAGTEITARLGIEKLANRCRHFGDWLRKIEALCLASRGSRSANYDK